MVKTRVGSFNPLPVVPVVLVGANVNGEPNYMTVGFVNGVNVDPAIVCVSLNRKHHTPKGISENGTFSINIPSVEYAEQTDYCGLVSGKTVDKTDIFTTFYGDLETAPMIEECPITCECTCIDRKEFPMDIVYFGEVHQVYVNENILTTKRRVDMAKTNPLLVGIDNLYRTVGKSAGQAYSMGWEFRRKEGSSKSAAHSSRAEFGQTVPDSDGCTCQFIDRPAQPTLSIRHRNASHNIPQLIGQALLEVMQYAGELGANPTGAPFVAYHGMNGGHMDMAVGFPFGKNLQGNDRISAGEIPKGTFASCLHVGPYDQLGGSRALLRQWMLDKGCSGAEGISYEFYLNDPRETPPDKLETQILIPLGSSISQ